MVSGQQSHWIFWSIPVPMFWSFLVININNMEEYSITKYSARRKFYDTLIINNKISKSQLTYIRGNFTTPSPMPLTKSFVIGEQERDELELFRNRVRFFLSKYFLNHVSNWQANNSTYMVRLHSIQPILRIYDLNYHLTSLNISG